MLLNNDVVVTDGWLDQLIALAALVHRRSTKSETPNPKRRTNIPNRWRVRPIRGGNITVMAAPSRTSRNRKSRTRSPIRMVGLVGPMSNYAAPPQLVEDVPYRDLDEMHAFARRWRDEHRGKWFTVPKLSGFCLLMKRAVYEAIGGLDERFGLGFFDDDDLAERARRAGFELAVAHDLFVHHFGSRTFVGNGIDAEKLLDENAASSPPSGGMTCPHG